MKKFIFDDLKTLCTYGENYVSYYNKHDEYCKVFFEPGEFNPMTGRKVKK